MNLLEAQVIVEDRETTRKAEFALREDLPWQLACLFPMPIMVNLELDEHNIEVTSLTMHTMAGPIRILEANKLCDIVDYLVSNGLVDRERIDKGKTATIVVLQQKIFKLRDLRKMIKEKGLQCLEIHKQLSIAATKISALSSDPYRVFAKAEEKNFQLSFVREDVKIGRKPWKLVLHVTRSTLFPTKVELEANRSSKWGEQLSIRVLTGNGSAGSIPGVEKYVESLGRQGRFLVEDKRFFTLDLASDEWAQLLHESALNLVKEIWVGGAMSAID